MTRARKEMQYRDSSDPKVANAGIQVRTVRKWEQRMMSKKPRSGYSTKTWWERSHGAELG